MALRQRLILVVPPGVAADALTAALGGGDVAAVIIAPGSTGTKSLVEAAQAEGAAALLATELLATELLATGLRATGLRADGPRGWPPLHGADGFHLLGGMDVRHAAVDARPEGATVGAAAYDRHEAMVLGESGADYLCFGGVEALDEEAVLLAAWWQSLFETPCVIAGPDRDDALAAMIASDAEFVATDVFSAADPAERVSFINAMLERKAGAS